MKVYESSHPKQRDFTKVPQIKIKNKKLINSGFMIGEDFNIGYKLGKLILSLVVNKKRE